MLNILYKTSLFSYETRLTKFLGGMIATFTGNREIGLCNDKSMPIGFFMHDYIPYIPTIASIAIGQGEYQTNIFETDTIYKINDLLYCSQNGLISNNTMYRNNIIVGIVNFVSSDIIGFITCFSNLESLNK